MNVTMIYFSQTGHTRIVAEAMAKAFRDAGYFTRMVTLKKATAQDATSSDLLGVGAPCYSSQAPTPVKAFLSTLPSLHNQRAFVFATSAGAPGRVLYDLSSMLRSKGANIAGGFLARGECHHPDPYLTGRFPNRPDAQDLRSAKRFAAALTQHVSAGLPGLVPGSRPDTLKPQGLFYNAVARLSTDRFLRLSLPEPKLDQKRCDQCQWCTYECPMHNITLQPYPTLGKQCIRCYRCLTGCPQQAFHADWRYSNLAISLFYNSIVERWFGDLQPGERMY